MSAASPPTPQDAQNRGTTVDDALAVSVAMLDAARADDWDRVASLAPERARALGADAGATPGPLPCSPRTRDTLLAIDRELLALSRRERDALAARWRDARTSNRVGRAYAEIAKADRPGTERPAP